MITYALTDVIRPKPIFRGGRVDDQYYVMYAVYTPSQSIYVGQSVDPILRIKQHIQSKDALGACIDANRPDSLGWLVDFLTLADLGYTGWYIGTKRKIVINRAEVAAIDRYRPILNIRRTTSYDRADRSWLDGEHV